MLARYLNCYQQYYTVGANSYSAWWDVQFPAVTSMQNVWYGLSEAAGNGGGTSSVWGYWDEELWHYAADYCWMESVPAEAGGQVKVQVPTSLSVHTALSDQCSHPPTCQPPGCTGGCAAYYYKFREYQVMDGASPPQPIRRTMTLSESFTTPQNSCNATFVQGQATTNSAGIFKDTFFFYGNSICDGGGSCTVVRNQTWRENSSNNNVASYTLTYTCSSFSIQ